MRLDERMQLATYTYSHLEQRPFCSIFLLFKVWKRIATLLILQERKTVSQDGGRGKGRRLSPFLRIINIEEQKLQVTRVEP
jgi:hypothetical protein